MTPSNANTSGLEACPFDGGAAFQGSTLDEGHYVMCSNEHCLGMVGYTETAQEAAEAWNRRVTAASAQAAIDAEKARADRLAQALEAVISYAPDIRPARIARAALQQETQP